MYTPSGVIVLVGIVVVIVSMFVIAGLISNIIVINMMIVRYKQRY
jgi:hypothetical protein